MIFEVAKHLYGCQEDESFDEDNAFARFKTVILPVMTIAVRTFDINNTASRRKELYTYIDQTPILDRVQRRVRCDSGSNRKRPVAFGPETTVQFSWTEISRSRIVWNPRL